MKKILFVILFFTLLFSFTVFSQAAKQVLLPDYELSVEKIYTSIPEKEVVINVEKGQWFNVDLKSNPGSTGYDWYISEKYDQNVIVLVSKSYMESEHPGNMVGVPGVTRCLFHAVGEGTTQFTLVYERPWENDSVPAETLKIKVVCE